MERLPDPLGVFAVDQQAETFDEAKFFDIGHLHQRDPERIRHDMEAGLVSPEAAERHYGWRG